VPIPGITELPRDDIGPWLACGLDCPFEIRPLHPEIETAFTWILMPLLENLLQHGTRKPALLLIRYGTDEKRGDFVEFVTLDTVKGFAFDVLQSLGRTMRFPRFEKMRLSHFGTGQGLAQAMNYADEMEILTGRYRWTLDSNDRCTLDSSSNGIPGSLVRARLWTRSPKRRRTELKNRINAWFFRMKTPSPFPGRTIRIAC
jgi:hypothetical protein